MIYGVYALHTENTHLDPIIWLQKITMLPCLKTIIAIAE